jgi:acetyl-CoA synthetase
MADDKEETGTSATEAQIAVHWREEEYFYPPARFIGQANASDPAIFDRFTEEHFPECFREYAELLDWDEYWHTTLDTSNPPFWKWFVGGRLNASYNCIDRHLATKANKAAFIWVPEPEAEETRTITYREMYRRVNELAAMLSGFCSLRTGDRVTLHMPMVPDLPVSMLACARLGVVHSEVFGGFSGTACGGRIADSGSRVLVTIDGYYRDGKWIDHKAKADEAVAVAKQEGVEIEKVLVFRRHAGQYLSKTPMVEGRDYFVDEVIVDYLRKVVPPVSMPAEAPLFLMYTSGTTGKPKGAQHSTGGYLSYVTGTSKYYLDIHPEDTYWCAADIG